MEKGVSALSRTLPRLGVRQLRLGGRRLAVAAVLILVALLSGWLWLRDSSLVAVRQVNVTGLAGPDAQQIRDALVRRARTMTTLDVSDSGLRAVVAAYPVVKALHVTTHFPHRLVIRVTEQLPVGAVQIGGTAVAVSADGTILRDVPGVGSLPLIALRVPPGGLRLTDGEGAQAVGVLAAAPAGLLGRITEVQRTGLGLTAQLRNGPLVIFGDGSDPAAKWAALTAVLAGGGAAGASYVDVSDPRRPAAGAGASSPAPASSAPPAAASGAGPSHP